MFKSIEEAKSAYETELEAYFVWNMKISAKVAAQKGLHISPEQTNWPHRLEGMEKALGLTPKEVASIHDTVKEQVRERVETYF